MASTKQANFLLSEEVIEMLNRSVEKRELSRFVETLLQKELKRLRNSGDTFNSGDTLLNY